MSIINALETSVAGMAAQANALSTIGTNIANNSTVGYKAASTTFENVLAQTAGATYDSGGVQTNVRSSVISQGVLTPTTSSTDLAITGKGFFVVSNNGQGAYMTRAGNFVPDASGNLVNAAGYQLMGYAGASTNLSPVNIAGASSVSFGADGTLTAVSGTGTAAATYKIPLATVASTDNLTAVSGNVFTVNAGSGGASLGLPGTNGNGVLSSGSLEQSTVDLGNELTNMIETQRSYEANSKVLQTSSDLLGILKSMSAG